MQRIKYITKNIKYKIKSLAIISTSAILLMPILAAADTIQVQQFNDPATQPGDFFGYSISIDSINQSTAVVGAPNYNNNGVLTGAAYVFIKNTSDGWTKVAQLQPKNVDYFNFGWSVSIDSNADQIVVGAKDSSGNTSGSAFIFNKPLNSVWGGSINQSSQLMDVNLSNNNTTTTGDEFGQAVSQSSNGSTIIVGAPQSQNNDTTVGVAYIYTEPVDGWDNNATINPTAQLNPQENTNEFGWSVALSNDNDGNSAYVGAPASNIASSGGVYIFNKPNDGWTNQFLQQNATINDPVNCTINQFNDCTTQGDGSSHTNGAFDSFGYSISIFGNNLIVGAPNFFYNNLNANTQATDSDGAVFTFQYDPNNLTWSQTNSQKPIVDPLDTNYDQFGLSVGFAADGASIFIGSPHSSVNGNSAEGNVYQYLPDTIDTSLWDLTNNYIPSIDESDQYFGWSVFALNNSNNQNQDNMFIGAPGASAFDDNTTNPIVNTASISSLNKSLKNSTNINTQTSINTQGSAYSINPSSLLKVNPSSAGVGAIVNISGVQNLTNVTSVNFAGNKTVNNVTHINTNSISVIVPAGAISGQLAVNTKIGNKPIAYKTSNFTVSSVPAPQVTSINPTTPGEGIKVTLNGKYMAKASVSFNDQSISLLSNDNGHIVFNVPLNAPHTNSVNITTASGTVNITLTVAQPTITGEGGAVKPGATITLNGHGLAGVKLYGSVVFNNNIVVPASKIIQDSDGSIKLIVPSGVPVHGTVTASAPSGTTAPRSY